MGSAVHVDTAAYDLTRVVDPVGDTVIATQRAQFRHLARFPEERPVHVDEAHDLGRVVDAGGDAVVAQATEVRHDAGPPEKGAARPAGSGAGAHDRAAAVDSIGDGVCATEGPKVGDHAILPEEGAY